jgi:hypothetical protein
MALGTPAYLTELATNVIPTATPSFTPTAFSIADSAGLSWDAIHSLGQYLGTSPGIRVKSWQAQVGPSPVSMTVTVSGSNCNNFTLHVFEITGSAVAAPTNVDDATSTSGDPALVLPGSPAASSAVISFTYHSGTGFDTVPTNFTSLRTTVFSTQTRMTTAYDAGLAGTGAAWSSTGANTIAIAFEVLELAAVTGTGAGTIPALVGAASGAHGVAGTAAGAVGSLVGTGSGVHGVTGSGAGAIPALVGAASGAHAVTGTGAGTMAPLAGAASGVHGVAGTGAGSIAALAGSASGVHGVAGAGAGTVPTLAGAAAGGHGVAGSGAGSIAALAGSAEGAHGDAGVIEFARRRPTMVAPGVLMGRAA